MWNHVERGNAASLWGVSKPGSFQALKEPAIGCRAAWQTQTAREELGRAHACLGTHGSPAWECALMLPDGSVGAEA